MYLYSSLDQLTKDIEPTFLHDITAAFDGLARPLRLTVGNAGGELRVELAGSESFLARLQGHVDVFFTSWTWDNPPKHLTDPREYTQSVTQAYGRKRERRKKR